MDIYEKIEKHVAQKHGAVANETKKLIGDFMLRCVLWVDFATIEQNVYQTAIRMKLVLKTQPAAAFKEGDSIGIKVRKTSL